MDCVKCFFRSKCKRKIDNQIGCCMGCWSECVRRGRGWCKDEIFCETVTIAGESVAIIDERANRRTVVSEATK